MKKLAYTLFISILLCANSLAQDLSLGFRTGISIPNLTAGSRQTPLNTGYSSRQGPEAAIFAELRFSTHFSIQPMLEYSSQGGKKNGLGQSSWTPKF